MSYSLSFGSEFYWGEYSPVDTIPGSPHPTCVAQALASLSQATWSKLAEQVFHCPPEFLDLPTVIEKIDATNTCLNLTSPVEVFIDVQGDFTIKVF